MAPSPEQVLATLTARPPHPVDVFGLEPKVAKAHYKKLMKRFHPDARTDDDDTVMAAITAALNELWTKYESMDRNGEWYLGTGDIAEVYTDGVKVFKRVLHPDDSDLMEREVRILKLLEMSPGFDDDQVNRYFPAVLESSDSETVLEYAGVVGDPSNLWTLKQLGDYYGHNLHPFHVGWIWKRLLVALDFAHRNGIIHAAPTPDNILILPENHGLILIDWKHASVNQELIRSIPNDWLDIYPEEVTKKLTPMPGLDFYLAAASMRWVSRSVFNKPTLEPLRRYFEWCMTDSQLARPDNFDLLKNRFEVTIYDRLGWQKKFVPMDDLVVWSELWT